jgi:hypothetical protein
MMDTIAQRLLESVSWGLKMRLYTGAGLSTMDLISDLFMIYTYATTNQEGTALSLTIMVGLCLLGQMFAVFCNTNKGPRRVMLKEMLIVLSGMKPGIDAKRVADGNKKAEHAVVDPDLELTCTRCFELVCESIPGTLASTARATSYFGLARRLGSSAKSDLLLLARALLGRPNDLLFSCSLRSLGLARCWDARTTSFFGARFARLSSRAAGTPE